MSITLIKPLTTDDPPELVLTANSYADLTFANAYMVKRPQASNWPSAVDDLGVTAADQQAQLMLAAMRVLESQKYLGVISNTTQPLQWPRVNEHWVTWRTTSAFANLVINAAGLYDYRARYWRVSEIPTPLLEAQCEIALAMVDDPSYNNTILGLMTMKSGGVDIDFRKHSRMLPPPASERLDGLLLSARGAYR